MSFTSLPSHGNKRSACELRGLPFVKCRSRFVIALTLLWIILEMHRYELVMILVKLKMQQEQPLFVLIITRSVTHHFTMASEARQQIKYYKCLAIDRSKSTKKRFFFLRKKISENNTKTTRHRKQFRRRRCTTSRDPKLGEEFRALHLVLVYFHVPRYGCSGNGPYFGLTLWNLERWYHLCLFVSLFCNVGIKVVERCQFHRVRDSLRLLAVPPRGLSVFRRGLYILFLALLTFKVKALIPTIARLWITGVKIFTIPPIWTWYQQ